MWTPTRSADLARRRRDVLLARVRPDVPRRLSDRERLVEAALAALVLAAGLAMAVLVAPFRGYDVLAAAACVAAYAAAARVPIYAGGGCVRPTQLVFVPMLFVLPLPYVPLLVVAGQCLAAVVDVAARREHPERVLTAAGDAGYALAPAAILLLAGAPAPDLGSWPVLLAALAAQFALDALLSTGREWLGRGIRPATQASVMGAVYGVDALLVAPGLLVSGRPVAGLALLPLLGLLAVVARDRNRRRGEAVDRLAELGRERARSHAAIQRLGRSFGATLDRRAMLEVALGAAADAVGAAGGRAALPGGDVVVTLAPGDGEAVLGRVEAVARSGWAARTHEDGWAAMAEPLRAYDDPGAAVVGTLAVCAAGREFTTTEQKLLAYLATQTRLSLEAIDLHERLRRQATVDDLTGLANHRRFHEVLEREVERSRRTGTPVSLVLLDVDDFKQVNDTHGHQAGDEVLRAVGDVLRRRCRTADLAARYGGEELAVVVADTGVEGAAVTAEDLRVAIAGLEVDTSAGRLRVTASFGVAELSPALPDRHALVAAADEALYTAKRAGKDRTAAFSSDPCSAAPRCTVVPRGAPGRSTTPA